MSDLNDIYEKIGKLHGRMDGLDTWCAETTKNTNDKFETLFQKVDANMEATVTLKTKVTLISSGIASVVMLIGTFVWDKLTGKN